MAAATRHRPGAQATRHKPLDYSQARPNLSRQRGPLAQDGGAGPTNVAPAGAQPDRGTAGETRPGPAPYTGIPRVRPGGGGGGGAGGGGAWGGGGAGWGGGPRAARLRRTNRAPPPPRG